jgi:hypothetical protein
MGGALRCFACGGHPSQKAKTSAQKNKSDLGVSK